jgi:L-amino acid N-acyltransferase YncA
MDIRDATDADLPHILAIYNDVVMTTTAIYDQTISTLAQRRAWFEDRRGQGLPVLVAQSNGEVVGFSSFGAWRHRWGYRYTVEHSVHVRADRRGRGYGRALVEALFPRAAAMGMHIMVAHIDAQAAASVHLHQKLGFEYVGTFREVAHKFERWLDLVCMQRKI